MEQSSQKSETTHGSNSKVRIGFTMQGKMSYLSDYYHTTSSGSHLLKWSSKRVSSSYHLSKSKLQNQFPIPIPISSFYKELAKNIKTTAFVISCPCFIRWGWNLGASSSNPSSSTLLVVHEICSTDQQPLYQQHMLDKKAVHVCCLMHYQSYLTDITAKIDCISGAYKRR